MAEVLQVPVASFFSEEGSAEGLPLFPKAEAAVVKTIGAVGISIRIKGFAPWDFEAKAQLFIELDLGSFAGTHFLSTKTSNSTVSYRERYTFVWDLKPLRRAKGT